MLKFRKGNSFGVNYYQCKNTVNTVQISHIVHYAQYDKYDIYEYISTHYPGTKLCTKYI